MASRRPSSFSGKYSDNLHVSTKQIAAEVLLSLGFEPSRLLERVSVTGASEPSMPCVMRVTDAMTAMHICVASLSNLYAEQRTRHLQNLSVNTETATMQMLACMSWEWSGRNFFPQYQGGDPAKPLVWREGTPALTGFPQPDELARFGRIYWNLFECADHRYVFLTPFINPYPPEKLLQFAGMTHANVPRFLSLLQKDDDFPEALQMMKDAVKNVPSAIELEKIMFKEKAGGCWAVKTMDEFLEADQGDWCRSQDQIHIDKVEGWAPAGFGDPLAPGESIYKGLKVVEMTRIVMGPVITSFLAGMGADVVRIASASVNEHPAWNLTQTTNKRCIALDLKNPADKAIMDALLDDADVVVQNNAYGAVERLGYGFESLCERFKNRKKGFVYAEGNTLGFTGPWASSGGFEQVGQICTGTALATGREVHGHEGTSPAGVKPYFYPGTMCDSTTGMSGAVGLHAALFRRAKEGGSYRVRVALARTGMFYQELGMYGDKALRQSLMKKSSYVDPLPDVNSRFFGVMDAFFQWRDALNEDLPQLFTDEHHMSFVDSTFGGVKLRIVRPAITMSENPIRIRIQPRVLGFDSTPDSKIYAAGAVKWIEGKLPADVEPDGKDGYYHTVSGSAQLQQQGVRL